MVTKSLLYHDDNLRNAHGGGVQGGPGGFLGATATQFENRPKGSIFKFSGDEIFWNFRHISHTFLYKNSNLLVQLKIFVHKLKRC